MIGMLRDMVRRADGRVEAVLASAGLSLAEWRLLSTLHEGAMAPSVLADRLCLTRGGVTKLVDRLRIRRLLVRAGAGGSDRRYQTIALTGAGVVLVRGLMEAVAGAEALTGAEREMIREALAT